MRTEDAEELVIESRPQVRAEAFAPDPSRPPPGYRACRRAPACLRWTTMPGTTCNTCLASGNAKDLASLNDVYGADWEPPHPLWCGSVEKPRMLDHERMLRAIVEASNHGLEELAAAVSTARIFLGS